MIFDLQNALELIRLDSHKKASDELGIPPCYGSSTLLQNSHPGTKIPAPQVRSAIDPSGFKKANSIQSTPPDHWTAHREH